MGCAPQGERPVLDAMLPQMHAPGSGEHVLCERVGLRPFFVGQSGCLLNPEPESRRRREPTQVERWADRAGIAVSLAVVCFAHRAEALSKTLPFLGPVAKKLGVAGAVISVGKAARDFYECAR